MSAAKRKYKPYPKYKDSGVEWLGQVPEHWDVRRAKHFLEEVVDLSDSGNEDLLSVSEYYGVKPRKLVIDPSERLSRSESLVGYKRCRVGDIAMNIMLAWKCGLGVSQFDGIISPAYSVFRAFDEVNSVYLDSLIRCPALTSAFKRFSTGVIDSRLRLYPEVFLGLQLLYPPPTEQTAIADFIERECGRMDKLVEKKQEFIALLKEKRQALITHAVTKGLDPKAAMKDSGVEWLGKVPKHWDIAKLGYLCRIETGSKDTQDALEEGDYPFYVRSQTPERINSYSYDCEAILTAGDGAGVGKVFHLVNGKFEAHQRVYVLHSFERLLINFAYYYFCEQFKQVALTGDAKSTVDSVRRFMLTMLPITIPPDREQHRIVEHIELQTTRIDRLIAKTHKSIDLLKERKTALITAAVTGKIQPPSAEVLRKTSELSAKSKKSKSTK